MTRALSGLLALLLAAPALRAQEGTVVTADGRSTPAADIRFSAGDDGPSLSFKDPAGTERSVPAADVVELVLGSRRTAPAPPPAAGDVEILRGTGDRFRGRVGKASDTGVVLESPVWGGRTVAFEQIRAVLFPLNRDAIPAEHPVPADADVILRKSGDRGEGTLVSISAAGVVYKSRRLDRDETVPVDETAAVWLVQFEPPPKTPGDLYSIVTTRDGSSVRGRVRSLEKGVLSIEDLYGETVKIPAGHVAAVYMKNGRVVYLSDLEPVSVEENANFIRGTEPRPSDLEYPYRRDRSAAGGPITIKGETHRKGLGVRAHSALTYETGGAYRRFQAVLGLDDASRGLGAVVARVFADDKQLLEVRLKGADAPHAVDLDVAGANRLRLVVTWDGFGQSDFTDWASARLVR